jgi:outer membrane murein-binding lipoprotein Lpp
MELFAPQTNPKTQPKPTLEADVRVLEKKLKEVEKQKIAEGKEADQAQKEAIALIREWVKGMN